MKIEEKTILWKPVSEYTGGRVLATNGLDILVGELNPEGDCVSEDCSGIHLCGITHFAKIAGFFPELKESEDERIRKALIDLFSSSAKKDWRDIPTEKILAWLEKQGGQKPNYCHHEVDLSGCSEEYRKAYYDGWNNCNMQHSQCKSELDDVVKCLINGMKFYYEDNEEATWGTDKWSMPVKHIIEVLEKQGEQNPADKVESKFHEGDWVVYNNDICQIVKREEGCNKLVTVFGIEKELVNERNLSTARFWTIQDAKDGDVLCYKDEISLYKHDIKNCTKQETTFGGFVYHCCYDGKRFITDSLYSLTEQDKMDIHPASKEQRDTLMKAMTDAGYTFDFEKKELKKIVQTPVEWHREDEQNLNACLGYIPDEFLRRWLMDAIHTKYDKLAEWSEEDEKMRNNLIRLLIRLSACTHTNSTSPSYSYPCEIDWLKSLRPQQQWKPTEAQLVSLTIACGRNDRIGFELRQLLKELKKL